MLNQHPTTFDTEEEDYEFFRSDTGLTEDEWFSSYRLWQSDIAVALGMTATQSMILADESVTIDELHSLLGIGLA